MSNKWSAAFRKIEGSISGDYDPFAHVIQTPSPSANWVFGRSHGLPQGYSMLLWGPPAGGKSLITNSIIGKLHKDDPEGIVVKFDTEGRDEGQMNAAARKMWGIDDDRYFPYFENEPAGVFNAIKDKVGKLVKMGAPVRLIIIDSISGVQGRQAAASKKGVEQYGMGDHAQTIQIGLKQILKLQRQHRISLICIAHARAEMDQAKIMRGHKTRANASFGCQHHCEYFTYVERDETKAGRVDALGNEFVDDSRKDFKDKGAQTGHKIRIWMQKTSFGAGGRNGQFTVDYQRGIVNQHEELKDLGERWGLIENPKQGQYIIAGKKFTGEAKLLQGLAEDPSLQTFITEGLLKMESEQKFKEATFEGPADKEADTSELDELFEEDEDQED